MSVYNCALMGDSGTGKTSLAKRHLTGEFFNPYTDNKEKIMKIFQLDFHTNRGIIRFKLWDTNDINDFDSENVQCAIIMADVSRSNTFESVPLLQASLRERFGAIPMALCGNKLDLGKKAALAYRIFMVDQDNFEYFEYFDISVKKCWNFGLPFLWLSGQLLNDPQVRFVPETAPVPPDSEFCKQEPIEYPPPVEDDDW